MSTEDDILSLRDKIHELKNFIDSPAWKQYTALVDAQRKGRTDQMILRPLAGLDETFAQEYTKGEIAGMRLAVHVMTQAVDDLQTELGKLEAYGAQDD